MGTAWRGRRVFRWFPYGNPGSYTAPILGWRVTLKPARSAVFTCTEANQPRSRRFLADWLNNIKWCAALTTNSTCSRATRSS